MTTATDELYAAKNESIHWAAVRVANRYRHIVDKEDLMSEAWVWALSHPRMVREIFRDVDEADQRTLTSALRRFGRKVEKVMEKVARAERAERTGYRPEDEYFYTIPLLETVLPALFITELRHVPPVVEKQEGKSNQDPAESGNWNVLILDVERAYNACELTLQERTALFLRYGVGLTEEKAGAEMHMSRYVLRDIAHGAMRRIAFKLNGIVPDNGAKDLEEEE